MSYDLKNKTMIMIALSVAFVIAMNHTGNAADADPSIPGAEFSDELLGIDAKTPLPGVVAADQVIDTAEVNEPMDTGDKNLQNLNSDPSLAFLTDEEATASVQAQSIAPSNPLLNVQPETSSEVPEESIIEDDEPIIPEAEAPKSPFENYGNAILSRVDSDLFNQMSNIEKQTTLLKLELKREELKNKVEALRVARYKAQEEEKLRKKAALEKEKNEEVERQAKILEEQAKLKEKEIELEKVRQAKVLNEYMNEMLRVNQRWIEKNARLQGKVQELEGERTDLIGAFKDRITELQKKTEELQAKADRAVEIHQQVATDLNTQIVELKEALAENENLIRQMREGAETKASGPTKDSIDMSKEYAIMDITGKGDDIVATLVSHDGTTFQVKKGSMLKNGEVIVSITEHYIEFENKGVQSYLYTSGTVRDYEPTVSFNDSGKTPEKGKSSGVKKSDTDDAGEVEEETEDEQQITSGPVSFGQGMFIQ